MANWNKSSTLLEFPFVALQPRSYPVERVEISPRTGKEAFDPLARRKPGPSGPGRPVAAPGCRDEELARRGQLIWEGTWGSFQLFGAIPCVVLGCLSCKKVARLSRKLSSPAVASLKRRSCVSRGKLAHRRTTAKPSAYSKWCSFAPMHSIR